MAAGYTAGYCVLIIEIKLNNSDDIGALIPASTAIITVGKQKK
ncbi:hypothetical protein [Mucilaginibacter sp.]|nr:hypothetical protein [Mucilaginibacter sp.]MDR3696557.1 hypothetical protein [Mucilaginibacter sp.]